MTIQVGDHIPDVVIKSLSASGMDDVHTGDLLGTGRIALFATPGAFTPTCTAKHLPSFVDNYSALQTAGIDQVFCLAVNDPFVMRMWLEQNDADSVVRPIADGNADFTRALGLAMDGSAYGLGTRAQRFSMLIEDGVVTQLNVEKPGEFGVSSGTALLESLNKSAA